MGVNFEVVDKEIYLVCEVLDDYKCNPVAVYKTKEKAERRLKSEIQRSKDNEEEMEFRILTMELHS